MQLCLATPLYPPEPGGPATYAKFLVDTLPQREISIAVVPFREVRHLPPVIRHIAYAIRLARVARRCDVMLAQDTFSVALPAVVVARLLHKPLLIRVPGDFVWEQSRQRFGVGDSIDVFQVEHYSFYVELLRNIQNWIVRSADRVIVPSQYFRKIVEGWGVPADDIVHVPNPVELPSEIPMLPHERVPRTIVSVGRFTPWKGFGTLISLISQLPEWRLILVGDGPLRQELEDTARAEGVSDRVVFTGALPRAEALAWCREADAFVLNTSFESFSFQVVEAMLLGVPVIATNIGSIPELIEHEKEGILVTPDDRSALIAAIQSTETGARVWENRVIAAKRKAETFAPRQVLDAVVVELERLV